jgi:protein-serine/threonine kinase
MGDDVELACGQASEDKKEKSLALATPPLTHTHTDTTASSTASVPSGGLSAAATHSISANAEQDAKLPSLDTAAAVRTPVVHIRTPSHQTPTRSPLTPGLQIRTDVNTPAPTVAAATQHTLDVKGQKELGNGSGSSASSSQPIAIERPGLRSTLSAASMASFHSLSPGSGSAISSPALNAMTDITPLPSPLLPGDSPGPWRRGHHRPGSAGSLSSSVREELLPEQISDLSGSVPTRISPSKAKKKAYGSLMPGAVDMGTARRSERSHSRNRSLSEFLPEAMHNFPRRHVTVASKHAGILDGGVDEPHLHREQYLAEQRGFVQPAQSTSSAPLPTPPPSNRSVTESEGDEAREDEPFVEYLTVKSGPLNRTRKYRPVRPLGQGTFSKVVLATSEKLPPKTILNEASEVYLNPKHLVAIKIVQHGPAGGADEERVELGLRREVELLRTISHPSLIHLEAFDFNDQEALLVLNYCPGGDLFDLASQQHDALTPPVVQRMFAELVGAVCYLHSKWIVHRDIKLENVLLNFPAASLANVESPFTYPHPLITLTDLGLSRTIPPPPDSPLLTTRCGSEDYAAPEILLSQPYDGRQTDAWALGVLLYALIEGRLPFDPPPQRPGSKPIRGRSRATHRIARCDWMWCKFGNDDGEWDPARGAGWEGARECVEGLLKKVTRGRWSMDELAQKDYIREAIQIAGGLKRPHTDEDMEDSET